MELLETISEIEKNEFSQSLTIARYTATLSREYSDSKQLSEANKFITEVQKLIDPDWVKKQTDKGITMLKNMVDMGVKGK